MRLKCEPELLLRLNKGPQRIERRLDADKHKALSGHLTRPPFFYVFISMHVSLFTFVANLQGSSHSNLFENRKSQGSAGANGSVTLVTPKAPRILRTCRGLP